MNLAPNSTLVVLYPDNNGLVCLCNLAREAAATEQHNQASRMSTEDQYRIYRDMIVMIVVMKM